jgi:hypothetical protein
MRADEIIYESRGVTARQAGETYVSDVDPDDILTIQDIAVLPQDAPEFASSEEMLQAVKQDIPQDSVKVDDNRYNSGTRAAIIASVTDNNGNPQHWVRYIKSVPPTGVHELWKTLRGYKFGAGAEKESVAIKPSDLIKDENYRTTDQLAREVVAGTQQLVSGTPEQALADVMVQAVKLARSGQVVPIEGAGKYFNVLQKYAGEYLGPLAIIDGGFTNGDTQKMLQAFGLQSLKGSQVSFPQDTAMELIDSIILTPDNQEIQVSSKISTAGGAASSLSGVVKQLPEESEQRFPQGVQIMRYLGTESAVNGPLLVARMFNIIDNQDIQALKDLDKSSQNIDDLGTERLRQMTQAQGVATDTPDRADYRVFFHTLTAIMNAVIPVVNSNAEFQGAMMAALNNNNYVQVVTKGKQRGDTVTLDYFTKFPAVFKGSPKLENKTYFATGQKGRVGFKLKR